MINPLKSVLLSSLQPPPNALFQDMAMHQIFTATCNSIGVSGGPEENILHSGCLGEPAHKQIFHSPKNNVIKSLGFMSSFLNLFLSLVRTNI